MKIGDVVHIKRNVWSREARDGIELDVEARVIFVHSEGRYYTVEFEIFGVPLRESFPLLRKGTCDENFETRKWSDWGHRMVESEKQRKERLIKNGKEK